MKKKNRGYATQKTREDRNVCFVQWNDNKPVNLLSSFVQKNPISNSTRWSKKDNRYIDVQCPDIVKKYNSEMGGVDLIDRYLALYRMRTKTNKWTFRAILHFIDLSACNAWVLYRENNPDTRNRDLKPLLQFKLDLADELMHGFYEEDRGSDDDSSSDEEPQQRRVVKPLPSVSARKKNAGHLPYYLDVKSSRRCRNPGCSRRTKVQCIDCDIPLCFCSNANCFLEFHD